MKKIKFFSSFQDEEKWLEQMAADGYKLAKRNTLQTLIYTFVPAPPEQVCIRADYRVFKTQHDFQDYCTLFEDSGWYHIAGTKDSGNQYFKRIDENSNEDIFSDTPSRAERYKRLSNNAFACCFFFVPLIFGGLMILNLDAFLNPRALWVTPGLWESETNFMWWRAFLFEMPFALMRGYVAPFMIFLSTTFTLFYLFIMAKSRKIYRMMLNADTD